MPFPAPFASLFCLSPLRIPIASLVPLLLVEWAELRTAARDFFETELIVEQVVTLYQTHNIQQSMHNEICIDSSNDVIGCNSKTASTVPVQPVGWWWFIDIK